MDSLSLGLSEIPPPILPRVCWPIDSLLRLGRCLLSTTKSPRQRPSRRGARLSLQMDPHLVPLLENPPTLRSSALPHRLAPTWLPLHFPSEKLYPRNLTDCAAGDASSRVRALTPLRVLRHRDDWQLC